MTGRAHARDMVRRRYFAHATPDGASSGERIVAAGYARGRHAKVTTGENLAWLHRHGDSPQDVVAAWMDSPPHRRVLLLRRFRRAGVAAVRGVPVRRLPGGGTTYALEAAD